MRVVFAAVSVLAIAAACSPQAKAPAAIAPGPTAYADLQKRLIEAKPGDVIEIAAGTFNFTEWPVAGRRRCHDQAARAIDQTILSTSKDQTGRRRGPAGDLRQRDAQRASPCRTPRATASSRKTPTGITYKNAEGRMDRRPASPPTAPMASIRSNPRTS